MTVETLSETRCFGGLQRTLTHSSALCNGPMRFALFLPPQALGGGRVPLVTYLAGLTCTEENFTVKAGAQRVAAELGLALLSPDTSPRGQEIPGEDESYDFGTGAGFYLDATQQPWSNAYRMYSYVTSELPGVIGETYGAEIDLGRQGIMGHSMGGHGALTIALKNPGTYRTVSAFAPIVAPSQVPWGEKAFTGYLGEDREAWKNYDATELVKRGRRAGGILIDQGTSDQFLEQQLKPEIFETACADAGQPLTLRRQSGYDHSYFFIATFMEDHLRHHAAGL